MSAVGKLATIAGALALAACDQAPVPAKPAAAPISQAGIVAFQASDAAFLKAAQPCEALPLVPSRSHQVGRFDEELASGGQVCGEAARQAEAIRFAVGLPTMVAADLDAAVAACALAFRGKAEAFDGMNRVAAGDADPLAIAAAAQSMRTAAHDVPACEERYAAAANATHLPRAPPPPLPTGPTAAEAAAASATAARLSKSVGAPIDSQPTDDLTPSQARVAGPRQWPRLQREGARKRRSR